VTRFNLSLPLHEFGAVDFDYVKVLVFFFFSIEHAVPINRSAYFFFSIEHAVPIN
jgi:hypothetical protein